MDGWHDMHVDIPCMRSAPMWMHTWVQCPPLELQPHIVGRERVLIALLRAEHHLGHPIDVLNAVDVNDHTTLVAHMLSWLHTMLRKMLQQKATMFSCEHPLRARQVGTSYIHPPQEFPAGHICRLTC